MKPKTQMIWRRVPSEIYRGWNCKMCGHFLPRLPAHTEECYECGGKSEQLSEDSANHIGDDDGCIRAT